MAVAHLPQRDAQQIVPAEVPTAALVISTMLSMITFAVLAVCSSKFSEAWCQKFEVLMMGPARRIQLVKDWRKIPLTRWRMSHESILEYSTDNERSHSGNLLGFDGLHLHNSRPGTWLRSQL